MWKHFFQESIFFLGAFFFRGAFFFGEHFDGEHFDGEDFDGEHFLESILQGAFVRRASDPESKRDPWLIKFRNKSTQSVE